MYLFRTSKISPDVSLLVSFSLVLAGGIALKFEWQQIFSDVHDSSEYFRQRCGLYGLNSSSDFQFPQTLSLSFVNCSKCAKYFWYNYHFHRPQFFSSLARSKYLSIFSLSFLFTLCAAGAAKSTGWQVVCLFVCLFFLFFFFFRWGLFDFCSVFLSVNARSCLSDRIKRSVCISKSQKNLWVLFLRTNSDLCPYHLLEW